MVLAASLLLNDTPDSRSVSNGDFCLRRFEGLARSVQSSAVLLLWCSTSPLPRRNNLSSRERFFGRCESATYDDCTSVLVLDFLDRIFFDFDVLSRGTFDEVRCFLGRLTSCEVSGRRFEEFEDNDRRRTGESPFSNSTCGFERREARIPDKLRVNES